MNLFFMMIVSEDIDESRGGGGRGLFQMGKWPDR